MQCNTVLTERQWEWGIVFHTIGAVGLVMLMVTGVAMESVGGWIVYPPQVVEGAKGGEKRQRLGESHRGIAWQAGLIWMRQSWKVAAIRSEWLMMLVFLTEREEWGWVCLLPWVSWMWKGIGIVWPDVGRHPLYDGMGRIWERAGVVALVGLGVLWLGEHLVPWMGYGAMALPVGMNLQGEPRVEVSKDEEGIYHVQLRGEFKMQVDGKVEFYKRMLVIFLGLLEVEGERRGSRRTRDGRTPFVRREQMEVWFGVPHPVISRWFNYWLKQDWRRMLSQRRGELLTMEVQQRVIESWVRFPWWSARRMWRHLQAQGSRITLNQVKQIGRESGWTTLRQALVRVYNISADAFRPRDEWLTEQLLAQIQELVKQLEVLGGLTPERQIALADLEELSAELGLHPTAAHRPLPWVLRLEQLLFGHWEDEEDETVRCIYCGTTQVSRKSRKPRLKRYVDEQGKIQTVEVYRYYCHNPACAHKSFTNLPPHLLPYSQWTVKHHLSALQIYDWMHSVYRRTAQTLGVSKATAYRWVSGFGYELLPVAALFGVVRSSGVVGIDEKYILVPKNDKVDGKMRRWMYIYFAVDCYTYDLLHIAVSPYNTKASAQAFLLALRAKGYHPRVIVTDMRVDYAPLVAQVFPQAVHHECIFHALQEVHKRIKEVYGANYKERHPEVETLRAEINHIFDARTKRTAQRRYEQVLAQRTKFVTQTPEVKVVFDLLERHWPKLVNAIESRLIPTTNNATEQVIRIFNQHYKTFCGFESIESARLYLAVFEKVYRFTPFSNDAQQRIRGKSPLELAGYEVQKLPITQLFRGMTLQWPASSYQELVPNA